jgi:ABC-type transport system involved in multi-copper enzyme maturation permease subunit
MIASAIMGVPVYRDIEHDTRGYYLSYPITEKGYLLGRYLGSLLVLVIVCLGALLGLMLGALLGPVFGFEEASRFGPLNLSAYVNATLVFLLPNLFFTGTLFFSLVALTRKIFVAYTGSILFFVGYLLASALTRDIEQRDLAALLDPFGLNAFNNESRYWTPVEQNTRLVPLAGTVLWNRLLWVGLALAVFGFTVYRFTFADFLAVKLGRRKGAAAAAEATLPAPLVRVPRVLPTFSAGVHLREMFRLAWLEFTNVTRDIYFLGILLGGVLFLFLDGWFGFPQFGTPSLPMTFYMLEVKDFNYIVFVYILLIFYTGEVVHRDRAVRFNQIADTLPVPNWLVYGSKLLALVYICLMLVTFPSCAACSTRCSKDTFTSTSASTSPTSTCSNCPSTCN